MQSKYTEALKQALTELLWYEDAGLGRISSCDAIHNIREAIEQPAQQEPLPPEWINDCVREAGETTEPDSDFACFEWLVRKVEAAHGIKGD